MASSVNVAASTGGLPSLFFRRVGPASGSTGGGHQDADRTADDQTSDESDHDSSFGSGVL